MSCDFCMIVDAFEHYLFVLSFFVAECALFVPQGWDYSPLPACKFSFGVLSTMLLLLSPESDHYLDYEKYTCFVSEYGSVVICCSSSMFFQKAKEPLSLWENPYAATTSWKPCAEKHDNGVSGKCSFK